ncbi:MAG: hypothetical protein ABI423_10150 [Burkholderiales bacterium]
MSTQLKTRLQSCAAFAALLVFTAASAQQPYDSITCRAGTITPLAQAEKVFVWALDHRGVSQTSDPKDPFNNFTQRCIGVVAAVEGKISGNGWCRSVDPKTGDWTLIDWTASDKPGHGTWSFRHGTGKWQGVTGGGTYEPTGATRPVEAGTYQNCVHGMGTWKLPG